MKAQTDEISRLEIVIQLEAESGLDSPIADSAKARLENIRRDAARHRDLLRNAGWPV